MLCPNCTAQNSPHSKFCRSCGISLSIKCANCGKENAAVAKFCVGCGKSLTPNKVANTESTPKVSNALGQNSLSEPSALYQSPDAAKALSPTVTITQGIHEEDQPRQSTDIPAARSPEIRNTGDNKAVSLKTHPLLPSNESLSAHTLEPISTITKAEVVLAQTLSNGAVYSEHREMLKQDSEWKVGFLLGNQVQERKPKAAPTTAVAPEQPTVGAATEPTAVSPNTTQAPCTYKAVIRGKYQGNWFDFDTADSGRNPLMFSVVKSNSILSESDLSPPVDWGLPAYDSSDNPFWQSGLAPKEFYPNPNIKASQLGDAKGTLNNMGSLQSDQNRFAIARHTYGEALEIYMKLAERDPEGYEADVQRVKANLDRLPQ